jgi:Predicted phosphohydrolase
MKLFAISDLHLSFSTEKPMDIFGTAWDNYFERISEDWKGKVSDDDVVLLAGDLSWGMSLSDAAADLAALDALPGKKVIIRGNHDYWWSSYAKVKQAVKNTAIIPVQNDAVKLGTHIICGTRGWDIAYSNSTDDDKKIYARELIRLEMSLNAAEKAEKRR